MTTVLDIILGLAVDDRAALAEVLR